MLRTAAVLLVLLAALPAHAANLAPGDGPVPFHVTNGTIAIAAADGGKVWRWQIDEGQSSALTLREDHPLWGRLRSFDRLRLEFRVSGGEINGLSLEMLGHVTGPRQYKVHQWGLAVRTTDRGVWHLRDLDLAQPEWFPWDNKDGHGTRRFLRLEAMALEPGTVIELRQIRLSPAYLYLKPNYEAPYTWPTWDGKQYRMPLRVLNASGRPTTISAAVVSEHAAFTVTLEPASQAVRAGEVASFEMVATLDAASRAKLPELYAESVRLAFAAAEHPDAPALWLGNLVRPLSSDIRRQVIVPEEALSEIRRRLADGDAVLRKALQLDRTIRAADAFCDIRLDHIPRNHSHVRNNLPRVPGVKPPRALQPGSFMPEIVDAETGFREVGTSLAGAFWKEYLAKVVDEVGTAYLLTGDDRYAAKGLELLMLYARQYGELNWYSMFDVPWFRGAPIHASSRVAGSSTYGTNILFRNFCRMLSMIAESPVWSDAQREEAYRGFVLPYATELMKFRGGISNMTDITNHNLLLLGIVFNDAGLVHFATHSDPGLIRRLTDIDADGFSSEGRPLNYQYAAMIEYVPSIVALQQSGLAVDVDIDRLAEALLMGYRRANLAGYVPITGDNARGWSVRANANADHLLAVFPQSEPLLAASKGTTPLSVLKRLSRKEALPPDAWRAMLETKPRLFRHAGFAILRHGETADQQVMVTLDYGRNVFHAAYDRNQLTLSAFGRIFSHGPGSLYNVGSGGMTRGTDPKMDRFASHGSLGHNLVLVDQQNQQRAVGRLLAWSDGASGPQVAVSRVDGVYPGVSHTRGVVLAGGDVVIVLDELRGEADHTYDFTYHNLGTLVLPEGWEATAASRPLGETANYDAIGDLRSLAGQGPVHLQWDLSQQIRAQALEAMEREGTAPEPMGLDFWQLQVAGGSLFLGNTGMNNPNTATMPDTAPSVFHRVKAAAGEPVRFMTVLHPYRQTSAVEAVAPLGEDGIRVTLTGGGTIEASLSGLIATHAVK